MSRAAAARDGVLTPAALLPCSLILLLALAPPETRGEGAAGGAALIVLLTLTAGARVTARCSRRALLAAAAAAVPLILVSGSPGESVSALAVWILALASGLAAWMLPVEGQGLHWSGPGLALAGGLVGAHGLYQRFWGLPGLAADLAGRVDFAYHREILDRVEDGRAFAAFSTPAAMGGFLALTLPVTVMLAWNSRGRARWLGFLAVLLQAGGLFSAASATAVVALVAAVVLAALAGARRSRLVLVPVVLALVAAAIGVAVLRGPELLDPDHGNNPLRLRAGNVRIAGEMVVDHPWAGVGPGGYGDHYPAYRRPDDNESMHVHNLPMELVAELGIPAGSALALTFFVVFLAPVACIRRRPAAGAGWTAGAAVGLAAFAIHNLADYTAFMPSLLWLAALLRGLLADPPADDGCRGEQLAAAGVVLLAAVAAGSGGLAWNARMTALDAEAAGNAGAALAAADRSVRLAPWDPDARLLRGRLLLAAGRVQTAADDVDAAIRLAPARPAARAARSRVRLLQGDLPGAWTDACQAARRYPADETLRDDAVMLGNRLRRGYGGD